MRERERKLEKERKRRPGREREIALARESKGQTDRNKDGQRLEIVWGQEFRRWTDGQVQLLYAA